MGLSLFLSAVVSTDEWDRPDNFADHMVDEKIAISEYSLSASVACGKVRILLSLLSVADVWN